jgi:pimeloyl-ACP methyl ester carboxylesterase
MKQINFMNTAQKYLPLFILFIAFASCHTKKDAVETKLTLETPTGKICGTLLVPGGFESGPVALIIAGSGPTDRDGNTMMGKNESLKKLAQGLASNNIATLRYDKRGIGESKAAGMDESKMRFDDLVNDAKGWLELLKKDKRFTKISVVGHSEGSLIGMVAANGNADKFVSVAGAGESADKILKTQFARLPDSLRNIIFPILDSLKAGKLVKITDMNLYSMFRPSVMPYIISWFKFDPQVEIKKLSIPCLIIQGTNDLQINSEDSKKLSAANPKAEVLMIDKMNHVFRIVESTDRQANIAVYTKPELPISEELVKGVSAFINK